MSQYMFEKTKVIRPRQKGRKQQDTARRSVATVSLPRSGRIPVLKVSFVQTIKRRFQANGAVSGLFSLGTGNTQFLVASTTTLLIGSVAAWRIKTIEGWSNQSPTNATGEGQINISNYGFNDIGQNNFNSPPWELVDTTNSSTYTAHVRKDFPLTDPTGSWHAMSSVNSASNLFRLSCSPTSTFDITFQVVVPYGSVIASPQSYPITGPAVPGNYYAIIPMSNLTPFAVNVIS